MKEFGRKLNTLFGYLLWLILIAGGVAGLAFIVLNIIGGGEGSFVETAAAFIQKQYFPIVIRVTAATILIGLVGMYLCGESALSMTSDKKEAEDELKAIKAEQSKEAK